MKFMLPLGIAALLCAHAAVAAVATCGEEMRPGVNRLSVVSGGKERSFDVTLPASFDRARGLPLVIALHGSGGNGAELDVRTGLSASGIAKGFAVMLPDGGIPMKRADGSLGYFWNIPGVPLVNGNAVPDDAPDDVKFISDAIDRVTKQGCVDAGKVFVTGMSGGGRMTSLLGCRLAGRIAAIAPVAGLRAGRAAAPDFAKPESNDCQPARPLSVLSFHGTDDDTNPFPGGQGLRWGYSVESAAARWAALGKCASKPTIEKLSGHLTRVTYGACDARSEVVLYEITAPRDQGGGHVWPTSAELKATDVMLDFFSRH